MKPYYSDDFDLHHALRLFAATPVHRARNIERGRTFVSKAGGIFAGVGLLRGVAYTIPGTVERGYVLRSGGSTADLLDAVTGKVVTVDPDECIEVDPRYQGDWTRSETLLRMVRDA